MRWVGPIQVHNDKFGSFSFDAPLATYEAPIWHTVQRGARVTRAAGGIFVNLVRENMTRSFIVEAPNSSVACSFIDAFASIDKARLVEIVETTSRYASFQELTNHIIGPLIFFRLSINSGNASGHNMATKAAEAIQNWILGNFKEFQLRYVSLSGNICCDKKNSAINGISGRGRYVVAESIIPADLCKESLQTTPQALVDLNLKKNYIGSIVSGGSWSANAHFANVLLAFYLALGQDGANIVEGSQGLVYCSLDDHGHLKFSVTIPNLILGTVGNGKDLPAVKANLQRLECLSKDGEAIQGGQKLALQAGATVLCAELSLLAALCNNGELMRAHEIIERKSSHRRFKSEKIF